jgi:Peptidase family M23
MRMGFRLQVGTIALILICSSACGSQPPKKAVHELGICSPILNGHSAVRQADGRVAGHNGIDFRSCGDDTVIAISSGIVSLAIMPTSQDERGTGGLMIVIHDTVNSGSVVVLYSHVTNIKVKSGDFVRKGEPLAQMWNSRDPNWTTHVHINQMSNGRDSIEDPISLFGGCIRERAEGFVYPVIC